MRFTTIKECQEKINNMRNLLEDFKKLNQIQFPIVIGDKDRKHFEHFAVNDINDTLYTLNKNIDKLQKELDRYKKAIDYKEENNSTSEDDEDYIKYANDNVF